MPATNANFIIESNVIHMSTLKNHKKNHGITVGL